MSSESIPVGLRALLSKHYFLAQITSGKKPCMTNMSFVDATTWIGKWSGKIMRFWYGEDRNTVMSDIENIISQTIDAINTHKNQSSFLRLIINALASTRVGLESMMTTYRNDPAMKGRIQVQLTNIDLQLDNHRALIKGYKDKEQEQDEKIVDTIVQESDITDKEGLKKFLLSHHINSISENKTEDNNNNNNNNNDDKLDKERIEKERLEKQKKKRPNQ